MQPRPAFPELLRQTERTLVGTFLYMPEPEIVRVLGQVPLDFVIVDLEHGAVGRFLGGSPVDQVIPGVELGPE